MIRCSPTSVIAAIASLACAVLLLAGTAAASGGKDGGPGKDGRPEVRTAGTCSARATSRLKLKSRDGAIELEFEVDHNRVGTRWRVAIVHERRVAWRGAARTAAPSGSFALERTLPDLPGADTVTARAWGPAGITCRATATLPSE